MSQLVISNPQVQTEAWAQGMDVRLVEVLYIKGSMNSGLR